MLLGGFEWFRVVYCFSSYRRVICRHGRNCDTYSQFEIRNNEHQQLGNYKPHKVSKQFSDVAEIFKESARQPSVKMDFKMTSFLTEFNLLLSDLNKLIRSRL